MTCQLVQVLWGLAWCMESHSSPPVHHSTQNGPSSTRSTFIADVLLVVIVVACIACAILVVIIVCLLRKLFRARSSQTDFGSDLNDAMLVTNFNTPEFTAVDVSTSAMNSTASSATKRDARHNVAIKAQKSHLKRSPDEVLKVK